MKTRIGFVAATLAVVASLVGCAAHGPTASQAGGVGMFAGGSNLDATRQWMTIDEKNRMVTLKIVTAMNGSANFNGHRHGNMTIAVPTHWRVRVQFRNESPTAYHSAMVVPFDGNRDRMVLHPVFKGAASPDPSLGTPAGREDTFQFDADKPGRYAIVCAVPEHRDKGMWTTFTVSDAIPTPRIYTNFEG